MPCYPWTKARCQTIPEPMLTYWQLGMHFGIDKSKIWNKTWNFSFNKMHLKMSSVIYLQNIQFKITQQKESLLYPVDSIKSSMMDCLFSLGSRTIFLWSALLFTYLRDNLHPNSARSCQLFLVNHLLNNCLRKWYDLYDRLIYSLQILDFAYDISMA